MSVGIEWEDSGKAIAVRIDGVEIAGYTYVPDDAQQESPRPGFQTLRTLAGDALSVFRPHDHTWHKSLAWSLPHLGEDNFWGGPSYRRGKDYQWLPNNGSMEHQDILEAGRIEGRFRFSHSLAWWTQAREHVVDELRTFEISESPDDDSWAIAFETSMQNVSGHDIRIGSPTTEGRENAGYGGLFWRGPRDFTGGRILGPDGLSGEELRGGRGEWLAFVGQHDGTCNHSTVMMVDDHRNEQHPPEWFTRSEPFACMGPAPFFSEEVLFSSGATLTNRYSFVAANGESTEERLADLAEAGRQALQNLKVGSRR
ncbi:PmoA family protein [Arthrobacter sp. R1-13]